ncbi:MAG TPA: hypothetical protein VFS34_05345 [Thermoanaerobaculia bacterium]|nr:hypothetical protein [Thermoanaerobaculia bacterium]
MKVSKNVPRPICACGNPRCPLPKFQAILKFGRRLSTAAVPRPASSTLSAA